jgi:Fe-S-cluster containining protein
MRETMLDDDCSADDVLPAGGFSDWLDGMARALRGEQDSDVPCGACTACCRSSQFVHIGPEERATLAHIPAELLFPAPRLPAGNVLLGYDENGHCPMLVDERCSIYEHRPRTCRTYDCRVFPAADVAPETGDLEPVARQVRRWRFDVQDDDDRARHQAVRAAAAYVQARAEVLPDGRPPANATQRAVLAVRLHEAFLGEDPDTGAPVAVEPSPEAVRALLAPDPPPRRRRRQ